MKIQQENERVCRPEKLIRADILKLSELLITVCRLICLFVFAGSMGVANCFAAEQSFVQVQSKSMSVIHKYQWNYDDARKLKKNPKGYCQYFYASNQISTITLKNKLLGKKIFSRAVPPVNDLWISPDEKFIVGFSRIDTLNPIKLFVLSSTGELLHFEYVEYSNYAVIPLNEYAWLKKNLYADFQVIDDLAIFKIDTYYIPLSDSDFSSGISAEALFFLWFRRKFLLPLLFYESNISDKAVEFETSTNENNMKNLKWYDNKSMGVEIREDGVNWFKLSFNSISNAQKIIVYFNSEELCNKQMEPPFM